MKKIRNLQTHKKRIISMNVEIENTLPEIAEEDAPILEEEPTPTLINPESKAPQTVQIEKQDIYDMMLGDAKMCHFVADILSGVPSDEAAKVHLVPVASPLKIDKDMIADVLASIDETLVLTDELENELQVLNANIYDEISRTKVLKVLCQGLHYEQMVSDAERRGYIKGRNENIEIKKAKGKKFMPELTEREASDKEQRDIAILKNPRKSIWDI